MSDMQTRIKVIKLPMAATGDVAPKNGHRAPKLMPIYGGGGRCRFPSQPTWRRLTWPTGQSTGHVYCTHRNANLTPRAGICLTSPDFETVVVNFPEKVASK